MHTASTTSLLQTSRLNENYILKKRFTSSQNISSPSHVESISNNSNNCSMLKSIGSKYFTPVKPVNQADCELKSIAKSDDLSTNDINVLTILNQKNEAIMNLEYNLYNASKETWKYQQKVCYKKLFY
jgi:hypothetical protein